MPYILEARSYIESFDILAGDKKEQMQQAIEDKLAVVDCKESDWYEYKNQEDYLKILYCMEMQAQVGLSVIDEMF